MMPTKLTPDKIAILKEKFSNTRTKDLALELGVSHHTVTGVAGKLGIKKSEAYLKLYAGRLKEGNQAKTFFPKGHKPWNAGTKGLTGANTGSFKKGIKPHNALADWQEVFYTDSNGKKYLKIKVPGIKVSVFKHIYLWEQHHQKKVPKNYLIRFKDGDTLNLDMDNLECITRKENMLKNSIHNLPAELKETILLVKHLNNKIKKHERANS